MEPIQRGREAFAERRWREAFDELSSADGGGSLAAADLELLATTAFLVGEDDASVDAWTRAHHEYAGAGEVARAARCAFWLGFGYINRGQRAPAMGWFARGKELIEKGEIDSAERGFLLIPMAIGMVDSDPATAYDLFSQAADIGRQFADPDVLAFATVGRGRSLLRLGRIDEGVAHLDEVMVSMTSGEHSAVTVGNAYCIVLEGCFEIFDIRRAREWTRELTRWCEAQPDLVPYRGQCLVHRAQVLHVHGEWDKALEEAQRACERLGGHPMAGEAQYQLAEIHRVRGEFAKAEEAFKNASRAGRDPQPGLALLRLAEGHVDAADAAIRRLLDSPTDPMRRTTYLAAAVEIMLAQNDVAAARAAADELSEIVAQRQTPLLTATAASAAGAVALAEGDVRSASARFDEARRTWSDLDVPYETARVRVNVARACRLVGDEDAAAMELDAARRTFEELGAALDLKALDTGGARAGGLTDRELEVLRLVATGKTNRAIASELVLSEKTIARHVSNIFTKLALSSRAAATAYAYEHDLI